MSGRPPIHQSFVFIQVHPWLKIWLNPAKPECWRGGPNLPDRLPARGAHPPRVRFYAPRGKPGRKRRLRVHPRAARTVSLPWPRPRFGRLQKADRQVRPATRENANPGKSSLLKVDKGGSSWRGMVEGGSALQALGNFLDGVPGPALVSLAPTQAVIGRAVGPAPARPVVFAVQNASLRRSKGSQT